MEVEKKEGESMAKQEEIMKKGQLEGKSVDAKMEGKAVDTKMEGTSVDESTNESTNDTMAGKATNTQLEGKSMIENKENMIKGQMEGNTTNAQLAGKSPDPQLAGKPAAEPPSNSLSPEQEALLHSLQLAIHSRDLPLCNVDPRGSSPLVSLCPSSLDETPLRSQTSPATCGTCAIIAPSGRVGATFAVADGSRQGRKPFLGYRDGKSALFCAAGK